MARRFCGWLVAALGLVAWGCGGGGGSDGPPDGGRADGGVGGETVVGDLPGSEVPAAVDVELEERLPSVPALITLTDGHGFSLEIGTSPLAISAWRDGELVWDGREAPVRVGVVAEHNPAMRYDPQLLPAGLEWLVPGAAVHHESIAGGTLLRFDLGAERQLELRAVVGGQGVFSLEAAPVEWRNEVLTAIHYRALNAEENFYGLGESFDRVARRGTIRHMHITLDLLQESGYNEAHFPIPLLTSTVGSGIFVEDRHPGLFDVCAATPEEVAVRFSTDRLRFHLLSGPTPLEVVGRYAKLAGMPALPPQWVFGILQWRNEVSGQEMVMDDARAMREHGLPCSGIWVDRPFATGHESFIFDPAKYPDSAQMVADLNAMGYRVAIWSAPYLSEGVQPEFGIAEKNGYFVESPDINFQKFGRLVDFTDPGLVELWQGLISNATGIGIEGFKLDYGEDVISGFNTVKTTFNFFNGEGSETMHHWYHYFYHKTYRDMLPGDFFLLNRAGCYGDQTVTSVAWPGDLCANFKYHGEDGHVGGLPAAIIGNQALSVSGYPFFGSDTGGYRHQRPTKEVLLRWVQHTALSPVLQFGGGGDNCNPWDFNSYPGEGGPSLYDQETVDIWRAFASLHIRLFPYTYTHAVQASKTGIPVTRPFGMVHPELNHHPDFQYFFGDSLAVAPVYRAEAGRNVMIPPGSWYDWFTGERFDGPKEQWFEPELARTVLLVRRGAIIPMLREGVQTLAPATDETVDSYASEHGRLAARIFPGEAATSFASVLGPELAVAPSGATGLEVTVGGLSPAFEGLDLTIECGDVAAAKAAPKSVTVAPGGALTAVPGPDQLSSCVGGCYWWDDETRRLQAALQPEAKTLSISF